jgi:hypothetical protein
MPLLEDRTASFIVRIWRETAELPTSACEWRGSIEHVSSGQRGFFRDLPAILEYMKPHLQQLGIDVTQRFWEQMSPALQDAPSREGSATPSVHGAVRSDDENVVGDQPCP